MNKICKSLDKKNAGDRRLTVHAVCKITSYMLQFDAQKAFRFGRRSASRKCPRKYWQVRLICVVLCRGRENGTMHR